MARSLLLEATSSVRRFLLARASRKRKLIIEVFVAYFLLLPVVLFLLIGHIFPTTQLTFPPKLWESRHALVVVAHPDDEALFFNPAILAMTTRRGGVGDVGLVVISSGNNYGLGSVRKAEIKNSCNALNIHRDRCEVLDVPELQDDPKKWWPSKPLQNIVQKYVEKWKIDTIITFDSGGVSGHINHRAVSDAIALYGSSTLPAPRMYALSTTSVLRKYTLLADLPLTLLKHLLSRVFLRHGTERALFVSSWSLYRQGLASFQAHASQYVWDRHIYVVLSRYMWFNDLILLAPKDPGPLSSESA